MMILSRFIFALALLPVWQFALPAAEPKIDFNRDVRPILSNNCFACHGPDEKERKGKLRLDTFAGATAVAIKAGKPDESELIARLVSADENELMPPPKSGKKKLSKSDVATLKAWVAQGANYATHWSYVRPVRPEVPKVPGVSTPIDAFIRAKLDEVKLSPSAPADKYTLIRRLSLDLTGLPPSIKDIDDYIADTSGKATEKLVDRLLASPAFGEHWARMWLDLARYADSAGYADDPPRTIWPYRDYIIKSFNDNKPYDRFTLEQLAGDLLPDATDITRTATAFHRNTMTNNEGGTSDEEFRNAAVIDRTNTTMAVWMGTSMACAQCHTHKYDPITQTEYFRFYAFFNNTADDDQTNESPTLNLDETSEKKAKRAELEKTLAELNKQKPEKKEDKEAHQKQQNELKAKIAELKPKVTVPVYVELDGKNRRITKLQRRGNYQDLGEMVTEGTPAAFNPWPKDAMANRLNLAKWIVTPENPLTARVAVNRFWEQLFGTGLVRTTEEFGTQGEPPSHPELLDWLAVEFQQTWDIKKLLKTMVLTQTYQQQSKTLPVHVELDADNRYLARGPRHRLSAEMVRDQALAISGLLSSKQFGPSVRPYRPSAGLSAAFGGGLDWQASSGEDKFRRGLYTEWRRTSPYPSMVTFDAPSREACTLRRIRTNTPLQALVTLNDPVYVEAAQALGRLASASGKTLDEQLTFAFRRCVARPPTEQELARLKVLFADSKSTFEKDPKKAESLATDPIGPLPKDAKAAELAAWTTVCNVLLNLDEVLMRR
jgi:mono/diheme cytochrome c family protein